MSALLQVQEALYQVLLSNSALMGKVAGIFVNLPEDQAHPFIVVGEGNETPLHTFKQNGMEVVTTIRIYYNQSASYLEALDILATMNEGLRDIELELERFLAVSLQYVSGGTVEENGPRADRQIEAVYRIVVQDQ